MANPNTPAGFAPVRYLAGNPWNGAANLYSIDSANGTAFYVGDPVASSGTADTNGIPGIVIGVAGSAIRGIIIAIGTNARGGPYVDPTNLTLVNAPASKTKNYYALVVDDPYVIFEGSEANSGGTALAATNMGENINFIAGTPATGVNVSAYLLDNAAHDTTSTRNFKLIRLVQRLDNAFGASAKWEVLINNHELKSGVTGV